MGADFAQGFRRSFLLWGALVPLAIMTSLGWRGVWSAVIGVGAASLVLRLAKARIGGVTGDVFGMIVEIVEAAVLVAFLIGSS
jgi:adenosylcobinamide-GDP ribazoletransferase